MRVRSGHPLQTMYAFHATLWAARPRPPQGPLVPLRGDHFATLAPHVAPYLDPFPVTFEQAAAAMARLDRMLVEPDGSCIYSGDHPAAWRLEGNLFDRDGRLLNLQLWGRCPPPAFDRLLNCLDWPATQVVFECARDGVYLAEAEFRRFAALPQTG